MYLIEIIYFLWNRTRTDQPNTKRMRWRNEGREGKREEETARLSHAKQRMSLMGKFSVTVSPVWNITTTLTSNSISHEHQTIASKEETRTRELEAPCKIVERTDFEVVSDKRGAREEPGEDHEDGNLQVSTHISLSNLCNQQLVQPWWVGSKEKESGPLGGDDVEKSSQSYLNVLNFRC